MERVNLLGSSIDRRTFSHDRVNVEISAPVIIPGPIQIDAIFYHLDAHRETIVDTFTETLLLDVLLCTFNREIN
jgi:hypothetical protein